MKSTCRVGPVPARRDAGPPISGAACRAAIRPARQAGPTSKGFTILELTIALGVFAVLIIAVGQSVSLFAKQRRAAQHRQLATQTAENLMEGLFARDWSELTAEKLAGERLPEFVERELPKARLAIELTDEAGPPAARRMRVEVGWNDVAGPVGRPAILTAWRYEP